MAAGDITRDTGSPTIVGNMRQLHGTIEVDSTSRVFALMGTVNSIISCHLVCSSGMGSARVRINSNAAGTATNGSIAVEGNHRAVATYRYVVNYR